MHCKITKIALGLAGLIFTVGLQAQAQNQADSMISNPKNKFEAIYASMVETINSTMSLESKLKRIKELDSEYLKTSYKMMDDSKTNPEILERADYLESWELYLKIVPFNQVKLSADKLKADRISCLEASSLVRASGQKPAAQDEEKGLGGFGVEDDSTIELLAKLCK